MSAPQPGFRPPPVNYQAAHHYLLGTLQQAWPNSGFLRTVGAMSGMLAFGADVAVSRHYARQREWLPENLSLPDRLAAIYAAEADRIAGRGAVAQSNAQAQSIVNVNVGPLAGERPPASRYLLEEGTQRDVDCFSCATAHFAGTEGSMRRAQHAAEREGGCGPECQQWLHLAAQEPAALLQRDWSPERIKNFPKEQQEMIGRFTPQLEELRRGLLGGKQGGDQRAALVDAAWQLKESTRFTGSGDGIDHPEVEPWVRKAEENLVVGERLRVGAFDRKTSDDLRHLRQFVGSDISDHKTLLQAADRADDVSFAAAAPAYGKLRPEDIGAMADRMHALREEFNAQRRSLTPQQQVFGALQTATPPRLPPGTAKVRPETILRFTLPTAAEAAAVTEPTDIADLQHRLSQGLEERGIRTVTRNLEANAEGSLEAYYNPETNNILLSTAIGTQQTPYSLEVRVHEAAHALVDSPTCNPRPSLSHEREEERAELATVAAMTDLAVPVELYDGTILPPGSRQVDWDDIARFDPGLARDARWAADWIVSAARGEDHALAGATCPALRG